MKRVSIVGTSCAGKTTLAATLARRLGVPHVELDSLYWEPGWKAASDDVFEARVRDAIAADGWVACGNYTRSVQPLLWSRADTIVWLDHGLPTILGRWARRTARRIWTREPCCNGNREKLLNQFRGRDALLWWILRTHGINRRRYGSLLSDERVVRLSSQREVDAWLGSSG